MDTPIPPLCAPCHLPFATAMDEYQMTSKKIVLCAVVLSFVVSVFGTILALGVFSSFFGLNASDSGSPFVFNRPKIFEKVTETVMQKEQQVLRQDELVVSVVERASPAVVSVVAAKDVPVIERYYADPFGDDPLFRRFFGQESPFQIPQYRSRGTEKQEVSSGTGFIVSSDGLVITNKHVVADAEAEYTVFLNSGVKKVAKVLARDPVQDLAVIKIEESKLPVIALGDSSKVKIGQTAIAIGNPLEFRNTVSVGVVSGLHRSIIASGAVGSAPEQLQELIQTDAAINPGNSGGPLLNLSGEVIAVNTAMAQGAENIGFAIPVNKARFILDSIRRHGRIVYPFLGVHYAPVTKELAEQKKLGRDYGALLVESEGIPAVVAGGPAARAGLKTGDVILSLNGEHIDEMHSLASLIQQYNVGDEVTIRVFRDGKEFEIKTKLDERK